MFKILKHNKVSTFLKGNPELEACFRNYHRFSRFLQAGLLASPAGHFEGGPPYGGTPALMTIWPRRGHIFILLSMIVLMNTISVSPSHTTLYNAKKLPKNRFRVHPFFQFVLHFVFTPFFVNTNFEHDNFSHSVNSTL